MTNRIPLPNPCPVCGGVVLYGGRGRRPVYCGPECKQATEIEAQRLRREAGRDAILADDLDGGARLESDGSRYSLSEEDLRDEAATGHDREEGDRPDDFEALGYVPDGYAERSARSRVRGQDPAAEWLAEHAPEALHDFGGDY